MREEHLAHRYLTLALEHLRHAQHALEAANEYLRRSQGIHASTKGKAMARIARARKLVSETQANVRPAWGVTLSVVDAMARKKKKKNGDRQEKAVQSGEGR